MLPIGKINIKDCVTGFLKYGLIGTSIRIEASSLCQLRCPICPQTGDLGVVGRGYLRFSDFKNFVNNYPHFKKIELSNYGEIFLNPELKEIMKYAYTKNISLMALNGVNLNTVSEEILECLVKYQFKVMGISVDGATNETYTIYRRGGNFDKVIENIKTINYYKQKYRTEFPKLFWQFVVFGHNEHELPVARKMAEALNMQFVPKLNWSDSFSPIRNKEFVKKEIGFISRQEYAQKTKKIYLADVCTQLWFDVQVNWDGKLLGCCTNRWGDFGNVFESTLHGCVKSEKYLYAKKMLLGLKKERKDIPCSQCPTYQKMQAMNHYLLPTLITKVVREVLFRVSNPIRRRAKTE